MPEPAKTDGAGDDLAGQATVMSEAAHEATLSVAECLEKIAEQARLNPRQEQLPSAHHVILELRACVTAYASALRDLNAPPESAVVAVKRMISDALGAAGPVRASITEAVVSWVIEAYFPPASSP
jgi:hypothetical protein